MSPFDSLSPFKKQRMEELEADQRSEDPLYPKRYPRIEERWSQDPENTPIQDESHLDDTAFDNIKSSAQRKSAGEFLEDFHSLGEATPVVINGRIRSKRVAGKKLMFLDVVNEFQKVQVMLNFSLVMKESTDSRSKWALFRYMIQVGDHICK